ncbi:Rep family protein, partial [Bacillus cereus]|uniref:Rep family protein n=2 Tax=Bacillus TaxID=1386 RepID=UPI00240733DE
MVKRKSSNSKDERTRNWTFIVYPESTPENWREIINDLHTPWIESPLHDKDVNP